MKNLAQAYAMKKKSKAPMNEKLNPRSEPAKPMSLDPKALAKMVMMSKMKKDEPAMMSEGGLVDDEAIDELPMEDDFEIEGEPMGLSEDDEAEDGLLQRVMNKRRMRL
jgi:hypothetical protein